MSNFIKLNPIKPGETLKDKVNEFIRGCEQYATGFGKLPSIVEAVGWQVYPLTPRYSVLYIKVTPGVGMINRIVTGETFGLDIQCISMCAYDRHCFVMPVVIHGDQVTGLTGQCVCLECLRGLVIETERKGEDVVRTIRNMCCGPMILTTAKL